MLHLPRTANRSALLAAVLVVVLALAGCGSSGPKKVSASAYVSSVCTSAASWFHSIQSAGASLESKVHSSPSIHSVKSAYVSFIDTLLHSTTRAEQQIKAAGTPSVKNGARFSSEVVHAFDLARRGLESAANQVTKAPTTSSTAFESAAGRVQADVQRSLASMSSLAPQKNPQLRAAAQKDPTCRRLHALG